MSLLIENGLVVTLDAALNLYEPGLVSVHGGAISAVGASGTQSSVHAERLDASNGIVIPGLLNAHTHSPENWSRGVVDRILYEDWAAAVWPRLDKLSSEEIRVAVLLGCAEMLHSGTTMLVDHFRQTPLRLEAAEAAVFAYREAGMRCAVALMLRDRIVPAWAEVATEDAVAICQYAIEHWHDPNGLVTVMLGPSAPHRCTDRLLEQVAAISAERGIFVQTHVDETKAQRSEAQQTYGHSTIQHMNSLGLLTERTSLAHCVWIDDADIDLLVRSGASVVHNPLSNLRLGSGAARVPTMVEAGVRLALGADGAASNDSLDMFEVMKAASLLPGASGFSKRPSVDDLWRMTADNIGARFGMPGAGVLAPGRKADIVVLERSDSRLYPLNNVYRQLVFGGGGWRARHVVIDGRVVVRDGKILTFDEDALFKEASKLTRCN